MRENQHETRAKKAKMAVRYITAGSLMIVWAIMWLIHMSIPSTNGWALTAVGVILSGVTVMVIGFRMGRIDQQANCEDDDAKKNDPSETAPQAKVTSPNYSDYQVGKTTPVH